jgi:trans-AT polyketide synthase, acyltransferase and oxidoreductase domains
MSTAQQHIIESLQQISVPWYVVQDNTTNELQLLVATETDINAVIAENKVNYLGYLPPIYPEYLGDRYFLELHKVKYPYIVGEMANGIATAECVIAAVQHGFMGSFGAAGLTPNIVEENLCRIKQTLGTTDSWGSNLIHSPNEPAIEAAVVDLYLKHDIVRVSSSAYMELSPHIVRYAFTGLHTDSNGHIQRKNHVLAKISRPEVARQFMQPVPTDMLRNLVANNLLTEQEANLATHLPVAEDITVEADSGGHTDNQVLTAQFPIIKQMSIEFSEQYQYARYLRVGAAGGLGTPHSLAAAFSMGADYVLTGSVNQGAVEAGVCEKAKELLAQAELADVEMAPAADMFELGVDLQVLKRGTMFSRRAIKLYDLYKKHNAIEEIPDADKTLLEKQYFRADLETVWQQTEVYFQERDPKQIEMAKKNPKYKMALIFRSYLGQSSRWAIIGDESRALDYQLWCGPAMGSFNYWTKDSFLATVAARTVGQIGLNLLEGAAVILRAQQLRLMGIGLPATFFYFPKKQLYG